MAKKKKKTLSKKTNGTLKSMSPLKQFSFRERDINNTIEYLNRYHTIKRCVKKARKKPCINSILIYITFGPKVNITNNSERIYYKISRYNKTLDDAIENFDTFVPLSKDDKSVIMRFIFESINPVLHHDTVYGLIDVLDKYKSYLSKYFPKIEKTLENTRNSLKHNTNNIITYNEHFKTSFLVTTPSELMDIYNKIDDKCKVTSKGDNILFTTSYFNFIYNDNISYEENESIFIEKHKYSIDSSLVDEIDLSKLTKNNKYYKIIENITTPHTRDNINITATINNVDPYSNRNFSNSFVDTSKYGDDTSMAWLVNHSVSSGIIGKFAQELSFQINFKKDFIYIAVMIIDALNLSYEHLPEHMVTVIDEYYTIYNEIKKNGQYPVMKIIDNKFVFTNLSSAEKEYIDVYGRS